MPTYPTLASQQVSDGAVNQYLLADSTSTAIDSIGAQNGSYNGSYTLEQSSIAAGESYSASINTSSDGYVQVPFSALPHNPTTGAFSFEFASEPTFANPNNSFLFYNSHEDVTGTGFRFICSNGILASGEFPTGFEFDAYFTVSGRVNVHTATNIFQIGQKYTIGVSYDGSTVTIYVNGVAAGSSAASGLITSGTNNIAFGSALAIGINQYNYIGFYQDLAFYPFSLTANQFYSHYQGFIGANIPVPTPGNFIQQYSTREQPRGQAIANMSGNQFALADFYTSQLQKFTNGVQTQSDNFFYLQEIGLSSATSDGDGGFWILGFLGSVCDFSSSFASGIPAFLPFSGTPYIASTVQQSSFYALSATGAVLNAAGTTVGSFGPPYPSIDLQPSGSSGVATLLTSKEIAILNVSTAGVSTQSITSTMTAPYCFAVNGGDYIVAGTAQSVFGSSPVVTLALNPAESIYLGGAKAGQALLYQNGATPNTWSQVYSVSGAVANPTASTWTTDGIQYLVTDSTDGQFQVIKLVLGTLVIQQTVTLTGAAGIGVLSDSIQGLICQPSQNNISPIYRSGGSWAVSGSIAVTSPNCITVTGPTTMAVGCGDAVNTYNFSGINWQLESAVALSFTPTFIASDVTGNVYAANNGNFAVVNGTLLATGTWSGTCTGLLAYNGQIVVLDGANNLVRIFSMSGTQETSFAFTAPSFIYQSGQSVFIGSSSAAPLIYNWTAPYTLRPNSSGVVAFYNSSSWSDTLLGPDHEPSAVIVGASGYVAVGTRENNLFLLATSGGVQASGVITRGIAGQSSGVPLGVSRFVVNEGILYSACSMAPQVIAIP